MSRKNSFIQEKIIVRLTFNPGLAKHFGFRPKLSTEVALAHFADRVLKKLDNGMLTGAVFLDLSKAFDTVDHSLLLTKLKQIGASDNVTVWPL